MSTTQTPKRYNNYRGNKNKPRNKRSHHTSPGYNNKFNNNQQDVPPRLRKKNNVYMNRRKNNHKNGKYYDNNNNRNYKSYRNNKNNRNKRNYRNNYNRNNYNNGYSQQNNQNINNNPFMNVDITQTQNEIYLYDNNANNANNNNNNNNNMVDNMNMVNGMNNISNMNGVHNNYNMNMNMNMNMNAINNINGMNNMYMNGVHHMNGMNSMNGVNGMNSMNNTNGIDNPYLTDNFNVLNNQINDDKIRYASDFQRIQQRQMEQMQQQMQQIQQMQQQQQISDEYLNQQSNSHHQQVHIHNVNLNPITDRNGIWSVNDNNDNNNNQTIENNKIFVNKDNPYHPQNFYKNQKKDANINKKRKIIQNNDQYDADAFSDEYFDFYDDPDPYIQRSSSSSSVGSKGSHRLSDDLLKDHSSIHAMDGSMTINRININNSLKKDDNVLVLDPSNGVDYLILKFVQIDGNTVLFRDFTGKSVHFWLDQLPNMFKPNREQQLQTNIDYNDNNVNNIDLSLYKEGTKIITEVNGYMTTMWIKSFDPNTTKCIAADFDGSINIFFLKNTKHSFG